MSPIFWKTQMTPMPLSCLVSSSERLGQKEDALPLFLRADQANPNIAVVKQELGNYLVENNQPMEAFPFFLMATRLDPNEPFYHHNLGNFVFLFQEHLTKLNEVKRWVY